MSRFLRAKKFMASKLSDSAAGRKVIIKFLGASGDRVLTALDSAIVKHSGRANAKTMRVDIFKLATKVGVLYQNHTLTEEHMAPAREPGMNLVNCLIETLESPPDTRDQERLAAAIMAAHDAMFEIIRTHMKESNARRLTELMTYLSSPGFLHAFLRDPNYESERDEILKNVKRLSRPIETEVAATREFQKERLQQRRNLLANLIERPVFEDYLRYEDTGKAVREWLVELSMQYSDHINFMHSVQDFKQINARNLLQNRAEMIYEKHFSAAATAPIPVSAEIVAAIQAHFDEDRIRKDMFDPALAAVNHGLAEIFNQGFRQSEHFLDLQHELEMIDFKLQTQFRVIEGDAEINLEELPSDDELLDAEDDDGEGETKG